MLGSSRSLPEWALKSASRSPFSCTFAMLTPQGKGSLGGRAPEVPACFPSSGQWVFSCCERCSWKECVCGSKFPQRQGGCWGEIPGPHFFLLFMWPAAIEVGQTAQRGILQSPLSFPGVSPPTPAPTCSFCLSFFPLPPPAEM